VQAAESPPAARPQPARVRAGGGLGRRENWLRDVAAHDGAVA
jgi:hypothetical protein